jgi:hypothetical protein
MLRLYNTKKYRVIPIERGSYDKSTEGLYDLETEGTYNKETHRAIEKYPWDPDNFETLGDLHDFLTEYLGFETELEDQWSGIRDFDWSKITEEVELPIQLTAA